MNGLSNEGTLDCFFRDDDVSRINEKCSKSWYFRFLFSLPDEGEYWFGVLAKGGGRFEDVATLGLTAEDVLESARFAVESSGPFEGVVKDV